MSGSATNNIQARVADIKYCSDRRCATQPSRHLVVSLREVSLRRDEATAVSYVWGEFNREKTPIGHVAGNSHKTVWMKLGKEWVIGDVMDRLVELATKKPIWIDQLCIPQNDEEITKTLANIPSIYRTFDVVILMPGHPCKCLPTLMREIGKVDRALSKSATSEAFKRCRLEFESCLNMTSTCSWIKRVWPRQELNYSEKVRCVWAAKEELPCVSMRAGEEDTANLAPFLARMYERLLRDGYNHDGAMWSLGSYSTELEVEQLAEIKLYVEGPGEQTIAEADAVYRFFSGEALKNGITRREDMPHLSKFAHNLIMLASRHGGPRRKATHARDYVISIWVDCPEYAIPRNYKSMDCPSLLQDALDQMNNTSERFLLTTAPLGLFESEQSGSALWKPPCYLPSCQIDDLSDIYNVLVNTNLGMLMPSSQKVPIIVDPTQTLPLSAAAKSFETLWQSFPQESAPSSFIEYFNTISQDWAEVTVGGVMDSINELLSPYSETERDSSGKLHFLVPPSDVLRMFILLQLFSRFPGVKASDFPQAAHQPYNFETLQLGAYELVSTALYLDLDMCYDKGMQLMFSGTDGHAKSVPRVGFCRRGVDIKRMSEKAMDPNERRVLTVRMDSEATESLLFEAEMVGHVDGLPGYRVFGVWVPIEPRDEGHYGAAAWYPERGDMNGYLV
ncbi:hypothetical protein SLS58_005922 [Diplodia intermedia]|uniref:Heterokaryon incompatibility domain-containing protein n=1 Tax=Diplodia intermedia TaxID=856260 RepID=A0ABR3TPF2_9PEZI